MFWPDITQFGRITSDVLGITQSVRGWAHSLRLFVVGKMVYMYPYFDLSMSFLKVVTCPSVMKICSTVFDIYKMVTRDRLMFFLNK